MRQMLDKSGRVSVAQGEAVRDLISDEACGPLLEHPETGSAKPRVGTGGLLEAALTRQNLQVAFKRVKANKGATVWPPGRPCRDLAGLWVFRSIVTGHSGLSFGNTDGFLA